eukprot:1027875-Prorocentrum_minimum.AAC.3
MTHWLLFRSSERARLGCRRDMPTPAGTMPTPAGTLMRPCFPTRASPRRSRSVTQQTNIREPRHFTHGSGREVGSISPPKPPPKGTAPSALGGQIVANAKSKKSPNAKSGSRFWGHLFRICRKTASPPARKQRGLDTDTVESTIQTLY